MSISSHSVILIYLQTLTFLLYLKPPSQLLIFYTHTALVYIHLSAKVKPSLNMP
jgi:hypothetical protein